MSARAAASRVLGLRQHRILLLAVVSSWLISAAPAAALSPVSAICPGAGLIGGGAEPGCSAGGPGAAVSGGLGGFAASATTGLALSAIGSWVFGGTSFVLHETGHVLARTTAPQLATTWFSTTYWRVAGIAAVLTLPFLFAAAVQAVVRSDLTLLVRAAGAYLPLAILAVAVAAPLTMLLLAASDQLAAVVSSAAGDQGAHFLVRAIAPIGALGGVSGSPFLAFLVGLFTVAGALVLWVELLMREAAVYVIVLLLPLAFAAFVWPARRVWAIRSVELLVALVLSKFAIVAILALGGAALGQGSGQDFAGVLAGLVLVVLAAFAPWALLRLLPLAEVASAAAGSLRPESRLAAHAFQRADLRATESHHWANKTSQMRRNADEAEPSGTGTTLAHRRRDIAPAPRGQAELGGGTEAASQDASDGATPDPGPRDATTHPAQSPNATTQPDSARGTTQPGEPMGSDTPLAAATSDLNRQRLPSERDDARGVREHWNIAGDSYGALEIQALADPDSPEKEGTRSPLTGPRGPGEDLADPTPQRQAPANGRL